MFSLLSSPPERNLTIFDVTDSVETQVLIY